jgi:josephin
MREKVKIETNLLFWPSEKMSSHPIFHERQSLQLCALHVLNNLLQEQVFSKSDLDSICLELAPGSFSWWNPHRSPGV